MSIQLVISILRILCDQYAQSEEQKALIYSARKFLDKAFSSYVEKKQLLDIINTIEDEFFVIICIDDEIKNIKAFIYNSVLKMEII